ncbi:MAG: leucine-rich repeat protein [Lachnospiraceae bacterium]
MKSKTYIKKTASFLLAGALIFTNSGSVFAANTQYGEIVDDGSKNIVTTDEQDNNPITFVPGITAGKVKIAKAKQTYNAKTNTYTVTLPKVTAKNKADQFLGWKDEKGKLYAAGKKVTVKATPDYEFKAAWKTKKGTDFTIKVSEKAKYNLKFSVTGKKTVSLLKYTGTCKCIHDLVLPTKVDFHNQTFKVTTIGSNAFKKANIKSLMIGKYITKIEKNAFQSDKWLKSVTILSTNLKSVGKNALKGIPKKATIICPPNKAEEYEKLFDKGGLNRDVTIKAVSTFAI